MDQFNQQICNDLLLLLNRSKVAAVQLAEEQGLTHVQLFALYWIHLSGSLPMGKVADVLHCDASNVTGIVDRLVSQGLVLRAESEHDRRTKTIRLTDKGTSIIEDLSMRLPEKLGCAKLSADERQSLHGILLNLVG